MFQVEQLPGEGSRLPRPEMLITGAFQKGLPGKLAG